MIPDISLSFRYDMKDAKWRWLAEVALVDQQAAGEERHLTKAVEAAGLAAERLARA